MPSGVPYLTRARWMLLSMAFGCFFVLSSQRINMSIAILNMVTREPNKTSNYCFTEENGGYNERYGDYDWTPSFQAQVHASYFYGLILMQIPAELIVEKFNAPSIALAGTGISSVCNFLVPVAADWHIASVIYVQFTKAMGHALVLPAFSAMLGKWIEPHRLILSLAYSATGIEVGGLVTLLLGGFICNFPGFGWPVLFYFSGSIGVAWCLLWVYFCYDARFMSSLTTGRKLSNRKYPRIDLPVPVCKILASKAFWGYVAAGIASYWMLAMNIFVMPTYFQSVFDVGIEWNGMFSSFSMVLQVFLYVFSITILRQRSSGKTSRRRFTMCMGMSVFATCVVLLTFVKCSQAMGVLLMMVGVGASGFTHAAMAVLPVDMSPNFSGILSAIMNTIGACAGCGLPLMVGYLTDGKMNDIRDWEKVFYACAFVVFICMILFMAYSSSETQPWDNPQTGRPTIFELSLLDPGRKSPNDGREIFHNSREGFPSTSTYI